MPFGRLPRCRRTNKEGRHVGLDFYDLLIEAFIKAESFLRAAGLICGRPPAFFVAGFRVAAGLDPRFRSAHRAFIAAAIRRRAAALSVRFRGPFESPLFGGRPRTSNRARNRSL